MVFSEIEKKERKREASRKHYLANKEKIIERTKQYRIGSKEKIAEKKKQYYEANKEKIKERTKQYRIRNKEKEKERNKQYYKTPQGKKMKKISSWKSLGLILPLDWYSILYDYYINTHHCEVCNNKFKSKRDRHMDHCHETGEFRWILCCNCNVHDNWKKKYNTNI